MDIVKVFGTNVKHYRETLGISQEVFAENAVSIEHISAPLNVTGEAYHWKTFKESQMPLELKPISYL